MSGPNGDPNISAENGIIDDEDEFGEEGNVSVHCNLTNWFILHELMENEPHKAFSVYSFVNWSQF